MKLTLVLLAMLLSACSAASAVAKPTLIPVEDFFRPPDRTGYKISPDGTRYSWLQPWEGRLNIYVATIGKQDAQRLTSAKDRDIRAYDWISDKMLAYLQDSGGNENDHIFSIPSSGGAVRDLTPYPGVKAQIVDILEDDPDHMLISLNQRDHRLFDVYRLDVNTGEKQMVAENSGKVVNWETDNDGNIRLAYEVEGTTVKVLYRDGASGAFKPIFQSDFRDSITPAGFTADGKRMYLISNAGRNFAALYEYNPADASQKLIYERTDSDIGGILWSKKRKTLLGCTYYTEKAGRHYFDDEAKAFFEKLKAHFAGFQVGVTSISKNERRLIIVVSSDRMPGRLYYYDKDVPDVYTELTNLYPWLKEESLAPMTPIAYQARDGLTIHGYLTLPVGATSGNLPAIMVVHGGPEVRDHWGYNPEVQLLANRGMAVLQVNYRVSTGYGKQFWEAGFKQWGLKQQDDITDGAKWLIEKGIADPKRFAIYGGSYGGYATLMGLIKTPDLFACGIDYVGVSSLFSLFEMMPAYWEPLRQTMYVTIGNPKDDVKQFMATSPVYHADKIVKPLFIAQGANDPRVAKRQSDEMVAAMRKRGVEVQYMVKENEGHGFSNVENSFDFYRAMEKFLAEHLKLDR